MAYAEDTVLLDIHEILDSDKPWRTWEVEDVADVTSFLADFTCVTLSVLSVILSSVMYTQMSFWMPSLEAQLWYIGMSATTEDMIDVFKDLTVIFGLLTLGCQCAVTKSFLDLIAFIPFLSVGAPTPSVALSNVFTM